MSGQERAPKVFISYSWDNESHKTWVKEFAACLRKDGVNVTLDQWHVRPGDQLPAFMEQAVRENDFVLIICTPSYKLKSENRTRGVGYEGDVIQSEVFLHSNHRKFIPVLREGDWLNSAPSQLAGKAYIVLKSGPDYGRNYDLLLRNLHSETENPPPIGPKPDFSNDAMTIPLQCDLKGHAEPVVRVATTANQNRIVSIDRYGQIIVWDIRTGVCVRMVATGYNYHGILAVAPNGRHAIALERHGGKYPPNLAIFDLEADSPPLVLEDDELESKYGYGNDVSAVAVTPDWRIAVSGSKRGQLAVWDIKAGIKLRTIEAYKATSEFDGWTRWKGGVESVVLSHDGSCAITLAEGYDGRIRVWNIRKGTLLGEFPAHKERYWDSDDASTRLGIKQICLTSDGTKLITGDVNGSLRVWEVATGLLLSELQGQGWVCCLAVSADGKIALSSGNSLGPENGKVSIWDLENGRKLDDRWYHSGTVYSLAVSADSRFVISGGDDKTVKVRTIIE